MGLRGKLVVRSLDDGIDGTSLLAETAIDALGHVDVVAGGSAGTVLAGFGLDGDGLGGADRLTQLAGDAALVSRGVSPQGVLATETRAQVTPLVGVVDGHLRFETDLEREGQTTNNFGQEENLGGAVKDGFPRSLCFRFVFVPPKTDRDNATEGSKTQRNKKRI